MALPASGSIKLSDVNTELGLTSTAAITLGTAGVRTLFGIGSGGIKLGDGYGKANEFGFTIASNASNVDVATAATAAGWNGSSKLVVTIDSGVYVSASSTGNAALTVSGTFAGGVELVNNGYIVGMGGAGGSATAYSGGSGSAGGLALSASSAITITNNGTIAGGGGGGGAGGTSVHLIPSYYSWAGGGGGGGGRSGLTNSSAGSSYSTYKHYYENGSPYGAGTATAGTLATAGSKASGGGIPGYGANGDYYLYGGNGGNGGGWGSSGSNGSSAYGNVGGGGANNGGGAGGSAGGAVSGNSNITWVSTGTRLGSIA